MAKQDGPVEWGLALQRAFVDSGADFIVLYDRRQKFLIDSAQFGEAMGWLYCEVVETGSQSTEWRYRLTEKGKEQVRNAQSFALADGVRGQIGA